MTTTRWCTVCKEFRGEHDHDPSLFDPPDAFDKGMAGSELAGQKWTERERERMDLAIEQAAAELDYFTADEVWVRARGIRVTKGLAGRLNAAANRGIIASTGDTTFAKRGGEHDHRQRLAVWRSLVR